LLIAERTFRRLNTPELLAKVAEGRDVCQWRAGEVEPAHI
jgi:hypothetical protein